jgi:UDP-glucose 6-dehydrogenase
VIVDKSTVPVGTADRVRESIAAALAARKLQTRLRRGLESLNS